MSGRNIKVGTRGSALALAQTRAFIAAFRRAHPDLECEECVIRTRGDIHLDTRLAGTGPSDKGLFTRELETALLHGGVDCAVHSLKDLPVEMPEGLSIGAILPREDPADVLVQKHGREVRRVATSSPRRALQLACKFPAVEVQEIRGNVPTRLKKLLADEKLDGLVLALAGLKRLGFCDSAAQWQVADFEELDLQILESMLPAPGQGAVAIQVRENDEELASLLRAVHCAETELCVSAERALLTELGGGCHLALGAKGAFEESGNAILRLRAVFFASAEPSRAFRGESAQVVRTVADAHQVAANLRNLWNPE